MEKQACLAGWVDFMAWEASKKGITHRDELSRIDLWLDLEGQDFSAKIKEIEDGCFGEKEVTVCLNTGDRNHGAELVLCFEDAAAAAKWILSKIPHPKKGPLWTWTHRSVFGLFDIPREYMVARGWEEPEKEEEEE